MNKKKNFEQIHLLTVPDRSVAEIIKKKLKDNKVQSRIILDPGPAGVFLGSYGAKEPLCSPYLIYIYKKDLEKARKVIKESEVINHENTAATKNKKEESNEEKRKRVFRLLAGIIFFLFFFSGMTMSLIDLLIQFLS